MLFRSSFTKLPKHKQFKYTPRYYDAEKERREQVRSEIRLGQDSGESYFAERWRSKKNHHSANRRVILFAALLLLLVYLILR